MYVLTHNNASKCFQKTLAWKWSKKETVARTMLTIYKKGYLGGGLGVARRSSRENDFISCNLGFSWDQSSFLANESKKVGIVETFYGKLAKK